MIRAEELRIGNLVEYRFTDEFDDRKEWWEVTEIDADDIHWLSKVDKEDEDFRPIELTEEILLKCPKDLVYPEWIKYLHDLQNWYYCNNNKKELHINL